MREKLIKARKRKKLSQTKAAKLLGISSSQLSMIETGKRKVTSVELAFKFEELLGVPAKSFRQAAPTAAQ